MGTRLVEDSKRKVEAFKIFLKTDRSQRKALDAFLDRANDLAYEVFQDQKSNLEVGAPLKPEELAAKFASKYTDLDPVTVQDAVHRGIEILVRVLGGASARNRPTRLFAVSPNFVLFAMSEQCVKVPHIGLCGYKRNKKGLAALDGADGYVARHAIQSTVVGYLNNDPILLLEV